MTLARRARDLRPSTTFRLARRVEELRAAGRDVLAFGLGEPDFATPEPVRNAGIEAIRAGKTHYTANEGIPELRRAIADWQLEEQGLRFDPVREVLVTAGAKQALANAMLALVDDGDEVLIPAPYWLTYPELVTLCGGRTRLVETRPEDGFHLRAEAVDAACTPRTRVLVLNSPNNPTGAVLSRDELVELAEVVERRDLIVISDEIYGPLTYVHPHVSIGAVRPGMRERTIVCHGLSKSFAMTGWRLGFAAGPAPILAAMARIQSHTTSNASSISQYAGLHAVAHCRGLVPAMRDEFDRRRRRVTEVLQSIPGLAMQIPEGAFYAFFTIRDLIGRRSPHGTVIDGSEAFCTALLEEAGVSLVPGVAFGWDQGARLSYAAGLSDLEEGCRRISRFVRSLDP